MLKKTKSSKTIKPHNLPIVWDRKLWSSMTSCRDTEHKVRDVDDILISANNKNEIERKTTFETKCVFKCTYDLVTTPTNNS